MNIKYLPTLLILFYSVLTFGQTPFPNPGKVFNDDIVPKVYIEIAPNDLTELYNTLENESHYPATFIFDNGSNPDTLLNVGLRFRGNTSLFSAKKSFKLSFNSFEPGRKYKGLEKMNINGEHNDPSVIRSKLGWDLFRQVEVPASRANHVELYINNEYYGLYINVEHIDEEFVQLRFGQELGNLYKCLWPATLEYLGTNPDLYKVESGDRRIYDLKTNKDEDDYSDIAQFIYILNNTSNDNLPCELEKVFDVQNYLKVIALDVLTANWDGPIFNKNNFYLYSNPQTGKIQYIPYDLDNTFGIQWFGEWVNRNIYTWAPNNEPRPIYTKIMANDIYRAQYTYYMSQYLDLFYNETSFFDNIDNIKNLIEASIPNDPLYPLDYGFDIDDFNNSYTQGLSANHVPIGLKEYVSGRQASALGQIESTNALPIISNIIQQDANANQDIFIRAKIEDEGLVNASIEYTFGSQTGQAILYDDGLHNDGNPNDEIYGAIIPAFNESGTFEYYIQATDLQSNTNRFPYCEVLNIPIEQSIIELYINEFQANNVSTVEDEAGEYDDWIELYNASNQAINLEGLFLSDDLDSPNKWALPEAMIQAGEFLIIWADNDIDQGIFHTNFKLSSSGETILLSNATGNTIDLISYGFQDDDDVTGRIPNGTGIMQNVFPTPGASNILSINTTEVSTSDFKVFPIPFDNQITIQGTSEIARIEISNLNGQQVLIKQTASSTVKVETDGLYPGIYFLKFKFKNGQTGIHKILKF